MVCASIHRSPLTLLLLFSSHCHAEQWAGFILTPAALKSQLNTNATQNPTLQRCWQKKINRGFNQSLHKSFFSVGEGGGGALSEDKIGQPKRFTIEEGEGEEEGDSSVRKKKISLPIPSFILTTEHEGFKRGEKVPTSILCCLPLLSSSSSSSSSSHTHSPPFPRMVTDKIRFLRNSEMCLFVQEDRRAFFNCRTRLWLVGRFFFLLSGCDVDFYYVLKFFSTPTAENKNKAYATDNN